jgi:hypothetical protein
MMTCRSPVRVYVISASRMPSRARKKAPRPSCSSWSMPIVCSPLAMFHLALEPCRCEPLLFVQCALYLEGGTSKVQTALPIHTQIRSPKQP